MLLQFIEYQENIVFLGQLGVGKIHFASILAMENIAKRYSVYFITAHDLVQSIQEESQWTNTIHCKLSFFTKPALLIIDEIGYRKMDETFAQFFFQIIAERHEKGSIILKSNKSFSMWGEIFGDSVLATEILDWPLHHSSKINIKGECYWNKEKKKVGFFRSEIPAEKD